MDTSIFHRLSNFLWGAIVLAVVTLALYISVGRYLMSNVAFWKDDILRELNARLPFVLEAAEVTGEWHSFTPELVFSGLRLHGANVDDLPLELDGGRVALDVWQSLRRRSLQIHKLSLQGLTLRAALTQEGKLQVPGLTAGGSPLGDWLAGFLLNIEQIELDDNRLALQLPGAGIRELDLDLDVLREGSKWRLEGLVQVAQTGAEVLVLGRGIGNPALPDSFSGDLYLEIGVADLKALLQVLPGPLGERVSSAAGEVKLRSWVAWRRGVPDIRLAISGRQLQVITGTQQPQRLPLDSLQVEAALARDDNGWHATLSDLRLSDNDNTLTLPRVQLSSRGERLELRAKRLPMSALSRYLVGMERLPVALRDLLSVLDPRGDITTLRAVLEDYTAVSSGWSVSANFGPLDLESWRGAPGGTRASGYLALDQDGGRVMLDSSRVALEFPRLFRDPLRYDELFGTVYINWHDDAVVLSSDIISARGIEGEATALFGLNIPLDKEDPVGLEMDLLVGLQDSSAAHRSKYLPFTLPDPLQRWLRDSIGAARVEEGAFLWRGSLRKKAKRLRTVQLFFDVAEAHLDFHPDWPALEQIDGLVLIDDLNVSVWADSARVFDSATRDLSAEAWKDEQSRLMLAVRGALRGPASDGLQVVNNSPLSGLVGDAFTRWQAQGQLHTDLELLLDLADVGASPGIDVQTVWQDVDITMQPGNLAFTAVSGQVDYSSDGGFSSRQLQGLLWGAPLTARVYQGPPDDAAAQPTPGRAPILIDLAGRVDLAAAGNWLDLDPMALASGSASAEGRITVARGTPPLLNLSSDLQGVALDLPEPWLKTAERVADFSLQLPLGGDSQVLSMALDQALFLDVALARPGVSGVALGFGTPPVKVVGGEVRLDGRVPRLDWEHWSRFIDSYLPVADPGIAGDEDPEPGPGGIDEGLLLHVSSMDVGELLFSGQQLQDVQLSLQQGRQHWDMAVQTGWLHGVLWAARDFSTAQLDIEHLDLDGLGQLRLDGLESTNPATLELPSMNVQLRQLVRGGEPFGQLAFDVASVPGGIAFSDISGDVVGLAVDPAQPAQMTWLADEQGSQSAITAQLQFLDLGQVLQRLRYQRFLETSNGKVNLQMQWPGGPHDVALVDARGSAQIEIAEGQFLEASAATAGSLRVVSILNLADFIDRLSLDMTHMFKSGIPFYSINADVALADNILSVIAADVAGRSSQFGFTGSADVLSRTLDGELAVTLPVADNLPWVAALVGGIPVAAGVFVVSQLFKEQMNRLASAIYHIEGPWNDPDVEFNRVFDNETRKAIRREDLEAVVQEATEAPPAETPTEPARDETAPTPVEP